MRILKTMVLTAFLAGSATAGMADGHAAPTSQMTEAETQIAVTATYTVIGILLGFALVNFINGASD